jgi:hypothetical protein
MGISYMVGVFWFGFSYCNGCGGGFENKKIMI